MAAKASMARHTSSCPPGGEFEFEFDINTKRWFGPMGSSWRMVRTHCGYGIVEHMSGDGRTALQWPPEPPWPAVCRLVRRHHFSTPRAWCTHERRKSGRGSPWRLERAHCCHGIAGTMPGAGGTALGWQPNAPQPAVHRLEYSQLFLQFADVHYVYITAPIV